MLIQMHTFKLVKLLFSTSVEGREERELEFGYV